MNPQPHTEPLAIDARQLVKTFGSFTAVDHLDLQVPTGTVVSLLGPNGAGKTTTVRILATLLRPDAGSATVNGYDIDTQGRQVRGTLSLTGQFAALDPNLTAKENLILMARLRGRTKKQARRSADGLLERFDAGEFADRITKQLSGGQRRRVDLAASLIDTPRLLVLDEPTTGLDPRSRQVVWTTIRELVAEGITLLLTTQYLEEADALADKVVLIDHGKEIAAGTPADLKSLVGSQRIDVVAADSAAFDRLADTLRWDGFDVTLDHEQRTIQLGAPEGLADLAKASSAVASTGIAVDEVALRRPTLDDAFISLTGQPAEPDQPDPDSDSHQPDRQIQEAVA